MNLKRSRQREGQTVYAIISLKVIREQKHDGITALKKKKKKKKEGKTPHLKASFNQQNDVSTQF